MKRNCLRDRIWNSCWKNPGWSNDNQISGFKVQRLCWGWWWLLGYQKEVIFTTLWCWAYRFFLHFEVMNMNLMSHVLYGALFQNRMIFFAVQPWCFRIVEVIFSSAATTCLVFAANRWGPLWELDRWTTVRFWSLGVVSWPGFFLSNKKGTLVV